MDLGTVEYATYVAGKIISESYMKKSMIYVGWNAMNMYITLGM